MNIVRTTLLTTAICASACASAQFSESWPQPARYNGTANGLDQAYAIATDKRGNTYVTGRSTETGGGPADITTIKYSPSGAELWVRPWDNPNANLTDVGNAIAVDNDGNAYVTGYTTTSNGDRDLVVLKLRSSDGFVLWATQYNNPDNSTSNDEGTAIALGQNGYVYVGGYTEPRTVSPMRDFLIIALNPTDGQPVSGWTPKVWRSSSVGGEQQIVAIAVGDSEGHVWVTGTAEGPELERVHWIDAMFHPDSNDPVWDTSITGTHKVARPTAVAVDAAGTMFVTGYRDVQQGSFASVYRTHAYEMSKNPSMIWWHEHNVGNSDQAHDLGIQTDFAGVAEYVYVTGQVGSEGNLNFGTVKYEAGYAGSNQRVWDRTYDRAGANDVARALAVAGNGNCYVTGYATASGVADYATLRYDAGGNLIGSSAIFYVGGVGADQARAIAASCAGLVHVTGQSLGSGTSDDYATLRYHQSVTTYVPTSFNLFRGNHVSGNLQSLQASDNDRYVAGPGLYLGGTESPLMLDVTSQINLQNPRSELCIVVEAHTSVTNLKQRIEVWDYVSNQYRPMDERASTTTDSDVFITSRNFYGPFDPARFINQSTGEVKVRIRYDQTGPVLAYPWQARIDFGGVMILD